MFSHIIWTLVLVAVVRAEGNDTNSTNDTNSANDSSSNETSSTVSTISANNCDSESSKACGVALTGLAENRNVSDVKPENIQKTCSVLTKCTSDQLKCFNTTVTTQDICADAVSPKCVKDLITKHSHIGFDMIVSVATDKSLPADYRCEFLNKERHPYLSNGEAEVNSVCGNDELEKFRQYVKNWRAIYKCTSN